MVSSRTVKQYVFKFGAIASAALGFVLAGTVFDTSLPLSSYGHFWLFITAGLCAAFIVGLITDHVLTRMMNAPIFPKVSSEIEKVCLSVERRFKGDRTDEEYRRAENGLFVLLALVVLIGLLFLTGIWTLQAFTIVLFLWIAKSIFIAFDASMRYGYKGLIGWTCVGFFFALFVKLFQGFS